jgi:hypothetical protein
VYPTGYVEPYPAFYLSLERFAKEASTRIAGIRLDGLPKRVRWRLRRVQKAQSRFYKRAANTLARLRSLAIKELKAIPFSGSDKSFIKKTLDVRGVGSGPPRYDGWWPKLIYGGSPSKWNPTVADVHTDPKSGKVLQVAVGNAHFLIAAIDNNGDKMIYVGPAYSYYEFHHPATDRLTDGKWQRILLSKPPTRPSWTDSYTQPGKKRHPTRH